MQHIEDLTHRIEFKGNIEPSLNTKEKTNSDVNDHVEIDPQPEERKSKIKQSTEPHHSPVPEHIELEPKKLLI